jgi:hypothetical protein
MVETATDGRLQLVKRFRTPRQEEVKTLVDMVLAHPNRYIKEILKNNDIPTSGTKEELREKFNDGLSTGKLTIPTLVNFLDEIEGWGNQHVYLYKSSDEHLAPIKDESEFVKVLKRVGLYGLLNKYNPIILPDVPKVTAIKLGNSRLRVQWVEKRTWENRLSEQDQKMEPQLNDGDGSWSQTEIIYKAYQINTKRGITTFDLDLVTGYGALMIQRLPSGSEYEEKKEFFEKEIEPIVKISSFERVRFGRAINKIMDSGEVISRQGGFQTAGGAKASFTSRTKKRDTKADPDLKKSQEALGPNAVAILGNFYWLPQSSRLERQLHVKMYSKDQRVGFFGECLEKEVRYVLSRIRSNCIRS